MAKKIKIQGVQITLENARITLKNLHKSDMNVRKTDAAAEDLVILKSSIEAAGLLQSLIVVKEKGGKYGVVGGGRRLQAIIELANENKIVPDDGDKELMIDCRIAPDGVSAEEISLMENVARSAMCPIDELKAYKALVAKKHNIDDIARHFGTSSASVTRRLKLANLHDDVLEAYKEGKLTLDQLKAFSLSDDHERQVEHLKSGYFHIPNIKRAMVTEQYEPNDSLVKFITVAAYEEAGGEINRYLFGEEFYLTDVNLVKKLVREKFQSIVQEQLADGWKWAEYCEDGNISGYQDYDRCYREYVDLTPEQEQELEKVRARIKELEESVDDADVMSEDEGDEYHTLNIREGELDQQQEVFTAEDKSRSGVVCYLDYYGDLEFHEGLIRAEDVEEIPAEGNDTGSQSDPSHANTVSEEEPTGADKDFTQALNDSLRSLRGRSMQAELAKNINLSKDVLLYNLTSSLSSGRPWDKPLSISTTKTWCDLNDDERDASTAWSELDEISDSLEIKWTGVKVKDFDVIAALPEETKDRLFAFCVARTLHNQLASQPGTNDLIEHIATLSGVNIRDYWTPTEKAFCKRITTAHLLAIGADIVDEGWALNRAKEKKADLAKAVAFLFDPENQNLNASQREKAANWLPEIMKVVSGADDIAVIEPSSELPAFLQEDLASKEDASRAAQ